MKINKDNVIKKILMLFLIISPIFDTIFFFSRYTTLVRVFIIFTLFISTLIMKRDARRKAVYIFLYYFLVLCYLAINYYRSFRFYSLVPGNFDYNIISEALTLIKLCMPVTLLFVIKHQDLSKEDYFKIINCWVILIAGSIVVLNVAKLSYSSYADGIIRYNIFNWNKSLDYRLTASRGYFVYANQEAVIMVMLLVLSVWEFLFSKKKYLINIILLELAMIMLGTRVSTIGGILTLCFLAISYIIITLIKKQHIKKRILLLLVPITTWILLIPITSYSNRNIELNTKIQSVNIQSEIVDNIDNAKIDKKEDFNRIEYVYSQYNENYLPKRFFEDYYPIKYDTDFWYEYVKNVEPESMTYRLTEEKIVNRILKVNNKKSDILFGISNTRIQNVVNLESDFKLHFYAFGIVGSFILLCIYFVIPLSIMFLLLKEKTYFYYTLLTSGLLYILISYLTGNIINSMTTIITYSFIAGGIFIKGNIPEKAD